MFYGNRNFLDDQFKSFGDDEQFCVECPARNSLEAEYEACGTARKGFHATLRVFEGETKQHMSKVVKATA